MAEEKLGKALQHAVLAAICFDKEHGAAIAVQVEAAHFDTVFRDFVRRVLAYRKRYRRPLSKTDAHDLAEQASFGKSGSVLQRRLVGDLLAEAKNINAAHAETRVHDFIRHQKLKGALSDAIHRFNNDDSKLVEDVEQIFTKALKYRAQTYDAGIFLNDPKGLDSAEERPDGFISLGIQELDVLDIGLIPQEMLLYIAPKGAGKTWFCVHCGRMALLAGKRVAHLSLEMGQRKTLRRYYQNLFAVARSGDSFKVTKPIIDDLGRMTDFTTFSRKPELSFRDPKSKAILKESMGHWGARFGNLVIKAFPTGRLSIGGIEGYLDYLENVHGFIPHVLIVDYPDLMETKGEYRLAVGKNFENLRGLCVDRNMALVAPTQGSRKTVNLRYVKSTHSAEDFHKVQAADTVLTFSRTKLEEKINVARLSVEHARDSVGGVEIFLSQSYETGQYVLPGWHSEVTEKVRKKLDVMIREAAQEAREEEDTDADD